MFIIQRSEEESADYQEENNENLQDEQQFIIQKSEPNESGIGEEFADMYEEVAEIFKSGGKGLIEGLTRLGRVMGPLLDKEGKSEKDIQEGVTERLEELIPSQGEEGFIQRGLRRGLGEAPTMMAFPGGSALQTLPRSIAAGFLGEGAKDLGAPEWVQAAAELTAYLGPDLTKKLLEKGSSQEIIKMGRRHGLTDDQITPLIQSDFKKKWLSKITPRRGRTREALQETQKGLGKAYDALKKSERASMEMSPENKEKLIRKFTDITQDIPSIVREKVKQDFVDFVKSPMNGASLMNLHKDINKSLGPMTKELVQYKQPIAEALYEINPELGRDFTNLNNLYSRYADIAGKLKPTLVSDIVSAGEALGIMGSLVLGDVSMLSKFLAEQGVKITAQEMLLNPRLNQLSEKFLMAVNQYKWPIAAKISNQMYDEIKKIDKDVDMETFSQEDLKELFGG